MKSRKAIEIEGSSKANVVRVQQNNYNGSTAQKWQLNRNANNTLQIKNITSEKSADIEEGAIKDGILV